MRLRSIELVLPDAKEATDFLLNIWGMAEAEHHKDTYYLRGSGHFPYLVALEEGNTSFVRSVTFVCDENELAAIQQNVQTHQLTARPTVSTDPGGGEGLLLELPDGEIFRFLVNAHEVSSIEGDDLPVKLTHVVFNSSDAEASGDFVEKMLNFTVSDRTKGMVFVRCNEYHHSTAFARAGFASLNHIAFEMQDLDAVMRGVGRLRDHRIAPSWGPGRHGPGDNAFAYYIAPFKAVIEFSTAVEIVPDDYKTGAPEDWTWPANRIDQWGLSDKDVDSLSAAEKHFLFKRTWAPQPN